MKRRNIISFTILVLTVITIILIASPNFEEKRSIAGFSQNSGMTLPATGVWNGFLDHMVVAEISNLDSTPADLDYTLKNSANEEIGSENIVIAANSTQHVILNKFPISDNYGTIILKSKDPSQTPNVNGFIVTYKLNGDNSVQYATSMPISNPMYGSSVGVYNSINPNPNQTNSVYNWLSVYNTSYSNFTAKVIVRDQLGNILPEAEINIRDLKPGGRLDSALGHPLGQVVGSYEILPEDPEAEYGAFLSRYSKVDENVFNFSMSIPASSGYTDSGLVPASTTGNAFNWGEIANFSGSKTPVSIEVFDRDGVVLLNEEIVLEPYSQKHIFLNSQLGPENVGYFRVKSIGESPGKIVVQSLYYGHADPSDSKITWAYNTLGTGGDYQNIASYPINTNLSAPNWLKLFNPNSETVQLEMQIFDQAGNKIEIGNSGKLTLTGSLDIPIHSLVGDDKVGMVQVRSVNSNLNFQGQIIRVYSNSNGARSATSSSGISYIAPFSAKGSQSSFYFPSYTTNEIPVLSPFPTPMYVKVNETVTGWIPVTPRNGLIGLYDLAGVPGLTLSFNGYFTFTPRTNQNKVGPTNFNIVAFNNYGQANRSYTINVLEGDNDPTNQAPYFDPPPPSLSWIVGKQYSNILQATDPDINEVRNLTFEFSGNSWGANIFPKVNQSANFTFTPPYEGSFPFTIKVRDPKGASNSTSFTITAKKEPSNEPPKIINIPNPIVAYANIRKDHNFQSNPSGASFSLVSKGGLAGLNVGANGQMTLVAGTHEIRPYPYTARLKATNSAGLSSEANFNIMVQAPSNNQPPVLNPLPIYNEVFLGDSKRFTVSASDPNGDRVSIGFVGSSYEATLTPLNDAKNSYTFSWRPKALGSQTFTIRASDGKGGTDDQSFQVNVINQPPTNKPPVVTNPGTITIRTGEEWNGQLYAYDPEGDRLETKIYMYPYNAVGFEAPINTGKMSWTPRLGQEGSYQVNFTVWDRINYAVGGRFTIIVQRYVAPPTYSIESIVWSQRTAVANLPFQVQWLAQKNTREPIPGDQLSFSTLTKPTFSTLTSGGLFQWTPSSADIGRKFEINANITDRNGKSTIGRQTLTVIGKNNPPEAIPNFPTHYATYVARILRIGSPFRDKDGDQLTCKLSLPNSAGIVLDERTCVISFIPFDSQAGRIFDVGIDAYDGTDSAHITLSIRVLPRTWWY